jgi:ribose transport system permease protein
MKKVIGISVLLLIVCLGTALKEPSFASSYNVQATLRWTGLFAIIGIGAAFVIITGGIDLSIGSVVGLTGVMFGWLLVNHHWSPSLAFAAMIAVSVVIGLIHGLLITLLKLPPFIVTLCGLMIWRGVIRTITSDATQGLGIGFQAMKHFVNNGLIQVVTRSKSPPAFDIPMTFVIMAVIGVISAFMLNRTIWGRYLLALGRNEDAARFSGIRTNWLVIASYVACSVLAGLAGVLFMVVGNSGGPTNFGNFYELYAIAAAVLGGCSLRGGEGSILGVVIGAAVLQVLRNAMPMLGIPSQSEPIVIGMVILIGAVVDEIVRRFAAARRTAAARAEASAGF